MVSARQREEIACERGSCCAVSLVMLRLGAARAFAQNAQITGTLKDQSGGVLPGATVTAHERGDRPDAHRHASEATASIRAAGAAARHVYWSPRSSSGFSIESRPKASCWSSIRPRSINFTLKPAAVAETVTVTGEPPLVDIDRVRRSSTSVSNAADPGPAGRVAALDRSRDAHAGHVAGQHPRLLLSRQRQHRRRHPRILERLRRRRREQHVGADGRAAPELRDGRDPRVQGVDVELQGGVRPRDRRRADGRHQVRHQPVARLGPAVLPRQVAHREDSSSRRRSPTSAAISTAARSAGRSSRTGRTSSSPTRHRREPVLHGQRRAALWPQYDGTFASDQDRWTYTVKVDHQLSQSQTLFVRYGAGGRVPPDHHRRRPRRTRPTASTSAVPRIVGGRRPHLGAEPVASLNDFRVPVRLREVRSVAAYSHGVVGAGRLRRRSPVASARAVFNYPSISARRLRQQPDGAGAALADQGRLLVSDARVGGTHQWKIGVDFSHIPFESDNLGSPLGTLDVPAGRAVQRQRPRRPGRRSTRTRCRPTPTSRSSTSRPTCRTTGSCASGLTLNLGLRYDVQFGSFNEDVPDLLARIEDKLGPAFGSSRFAVPFHARRRSRGDRNNFGPRVGVAWDVVGDGAHQRPCRLRPVLRQHAHAAELRRADLAAGAKHHHQQPELPGSRCRARRAISSCRRRRRTSPSWRTTPSTRTRTSSASASSRMLGRELRR